MRPAALRTVVAGALLSLPGALLAGVATTPATGAAAAAAEAPALRIGTYNIRAGVPLATFRDAVAELKPMADVIGLQEIGSNDRNKHLVADHDWGYFRPPKLQQNPIIWRRDLFDFVGARGYRIAEKRDLGGEHSGDDTKGDSWATIVRLVQRSSGEQLSFVNVHLVRGAVKGGRPAPGKPKLFELYVDQVAGTVRAIKAERARSDTDRVYVLGDFNVGYEADAKQRHKKLPYRKFGAIGFTSMWQGSPLLDKPYGTHNDALIDQVWATESPTRTDIVRSVQGSDHYPAVATYALSTPDPGYQPVDGTVGFGTVRLVANGNQPGDTENNGPAKVPSMFIELTGDLHHGYVEIELEEGSAKQGYDHDFVLDTSSLYDNDFTNDEIAVDIVGDDVPEGDETFTLRLVDPVNTTILQPDTIVITIKDND